MIEDETPAGVKKIEDIGVFAVTATFSIFAYIWVFIALLDYTVQPYEAVVTFGLMFIFLACALAADKARQAHMRKKADERFG